MLNMKSIKGLFRILIIFLLFAENIFSQEQIRFVGFSPDVDGFIEDGWDAADTYQINRPFRNEVPTIGSSWWRALFDEENFYVAICVDDNNHWPGWEAGGENGDYDRPEIYWDVNEALDDGKGAKDVGSGHYQFAESFADGYYDTPVIIGKSGNNPGGTYAYSLYGEGYFYELSVPLANFKDALGNSITAETHRDIGFDVTIVDQDEGITTSPQRYVWSNDGNGNNGSTDESWNNMDGAGTIKFGLWDIIYWGPILRLSACNITLASQAASSDSVYVSTDYDFPWTAVDDASWLSISPVTGSGSRFIKVTATENMGVRRTANILFDWVGNRGAEFTVTQLAKGEVGISETKIKQVLIYPNPTLDKITIQGGIDKVQLFNSLGVLVKETAVVGKTVSISELPNGVYIVKAYKNGQFKGVTKIIKN